MDTFLGVTHGARGKAWPVPWCQSSSCFRTLLILLKTPAVSAVGLVFNETDLDAGLFLDGFLALLFDDFLFLIRFPVCTDTLLFPLRFHFGASFVELVLDC